MQTFDVLIEIPKGSRNIWIWFWIKKNSIWQNVILFYDVSCWFGFVPETLALDGDLLDVLVLGHEPTFPMCVVEVRPIGVFHMVDEKGPDEKIICVPISDPIWSNKMDLTDLNPHRLKEIEHFFEVYKDLEKKKVDVGGWGNATEALAIFKKCVKRYENSIHKTKGDFTI